jgi:hypothetical protein
VSTPDAPPLPFLARFPVVFGWGLRRTLRAKKFLFGAALGVGASWLLAGLGPTWRDRPFVLWEFLDNAVLAVGIPLVALGLVGGGFGDEVADHTLVYHLARPVSRTTLFVARFFSGLVPGAIVGAALPVAAALGNGAPLPAHVVASTALFGALGVAVLGAVYYALAAVFRRGVVAGLIYTFVLEGFFQFLPGSIQNLSLSHHVRSLFHRAADADFAALSERVRSRVEGLSRVGRDEQGDVMFAAAVERWSSVSGALVTCAVAFVLSLALGARAVRKKDFALRD